MSEEVAAPQGTKNIVVAPAIKSICSSTGKKQQCLTSSIRFLALRHPRTKTLVLYGLSDSMANRSDDTEKAENCTEAQKGTIDFLEVQTINEDFGAWFIGESILGETRALLQLCTPMDPLLVILPYLIDASEKGTLVPLEDLLHDALTEENVDGNDVFDGRCFSILDELLKSSLISNRLHKVADSKGSKDLNVWKWNEEKTLAFLGKKVVRLERCLKQNKKSIAEDGSVETAFAFTSKDDQAKRQLEATDKRYLRLAWEIVSEYLVESLSDKLAQKLEINLQESQPIPLIKKPRLEGTSSTAPLDDYTKGRKSATQQQKNKEKTAKEKAASRASAGTKSIASFFGKRPQK